MTKDLIKKIQDMLSDYWRDIDFLMELGNDYCDIDIDWYEEQQDRVEDLQAEIDKATYEKND